MACHRILRNLMWVAQGATGEWGSALRGERDGAPVVETPAPMSASQFAGGFDVWYHHIRRNPKDAARRSDAAVRTRAAAIAKL